jgi:murein L,D-transpeptidase YcbB/YkuD
MRAERFDAAEYEGVDMRGKNLAIAVAMVVVIAAGFLLARSLSSNSDTPGDDQATPAKTPSAEPQTEAPEGSGNSATAQQQARALTQQIVTALDELEACAQRWDDEVVPLLTNAHGTLLTSDPTLVRQFSRLYARVDSQQIRRTSGALRSTVQEFATMLDAVEDDSYSPSEEFLSGLQATQATVVGLLDTCRETHREMAALLSAAERRAADPNTVTLQAAMARQTTPSR